MDTATKTEAVIELNNQLVRFAYTWSKANGMPDSVSAAAIFLLAKKVRAAIPAGQVVIIDQISDMIEMITEGVSTKEADTFLNEMHIAEDK